MAAAVDEADAAAAALRSETAIATDATTTKSTNAEAAGAGYGEVGGAQSQPSEDPGLAASRKKQQHQQSQQQRQQPQQQQEQQQQEQCREGSCRYDRFLLPPGLVVHRLLDHVTGVQLRVKWW